MASFTKVGSTLVEHKFPLTLYRSTVSGAKVVIVDHPSTMVNAEISFATAHQDDSGLAHTLEHLVFIGSKNYPYAKFLDNVAEKSYGYINASTNLSNTVFSIQIVGAEGFTKLLPIYLDNLFNPLLTESAYITEVHHINGEGQDGGVVYSEMKGKDYRELPKLRALTLGEDSPFAKNVGGDPKVIRESCNLERIKAYHKKFYRMENAIIAIVGTVPHQKVLNVIEEFEKSNGLVKKNDFVRTYEDYNPPKITGVTVERMEIPVDGDHGTVHVCWRGPDIWEEDIFPISKLLKYLSTGPESPLYHHYVNRSPPICSQIYFRSDKYKAFIIGFTFQRVNAEFLSPEKEHIFKEDLINLMKNHNFDLGRMHDILNREIEQIGRFLEGRVFNSIFSEIKLYQNYAPGISPDFDELTYLTSCHIEECERALNYDEDYWQQLINKYLNENNIVLYAIPNKDLIEKKKKEEDERLKKQVESLGPEGLKRCAEILEQAVAANKASEANPELLDKYATSELIDFAVIPVERSMENHRNTSMTAPIITHKLESNFIKFKLLLNGEKIPKHLHPFMKLYINILPLSNALIDGKLVPCEELSAVRKTELLSYSIQSYKNKIEIDVLSTILNASKVPIWIDTYLNKLIFEKPIIERVLKKILTYADEEKRHDEIIVTALTSMLIDVPETMDYYSYAIESQTFHKKIVDQLDNDTFVIYLIEKLIEIKEHLSKVDANLHLIGNPAEIKRLDFSSWPRLSGKNLIIDHPEKTQDYSRGAGKAYCISRSECTSAYFVQFVQAPLNVKSPEFTYSNLLNLYFCESSGVLYNEVRGKGFAYHVGLSVFRNVGLKLKIEKATNLSGAYETTKRCVFETIESGRLDPELFETTKRFLIRRYVNTECTIIQAGENSYNDHMDGFDFDESYNQMRIAHIKAATSDKVLKSIGSLYLDLFDESKCGKAMVIPTAAEESIKEVFPHVEFKTVDDLVRDIDINFNSYEVK